MSLVANEEKIFIRIGTKIINAKDFLSLMFLKIENNNAYFNIKFKIGKQIRSGQLVIKKNNTKEKIQFILSHLNKVNPDKYFISIFYGIYNINDICSVIYDKKNNIDTYNMLLNYKVNGLNYQFNLIIYDHQKIITPARVNRLYKAINSKKSFIKCGNNIFKRSIINYLEIIDNDRILINYNLESKEISMIFHMEDKDLCNFVFNDIFTQLKQTK